MATIKTGLIILLTRLFGVIHWQPPGWLVGLWAGLKRGYLWLVKNPTRSILALGLLLSLVIAAWFGYAWWQSRPQPVTVDFTVPAIERAELDKQAPPNPLLINFNSSVAPLALVGKTLSHEVSIKPALAGEWRWQDDKTLAFTPEQEWPAGQVLRIAFEKTLVAAQIQLARWAFTANTPAFDATLVKSEFYQDPLDANLKKAIIQLRFSHPVDGQTLENNISLTLKNLAEDTAAAKKLPFTVTYDSLKLNAFVHSQALPVPRYDQQVNFSLNTQVRPVNTDTTNSTPISTQVLVPGLYNGLTISDAQLTVMPNNQNQQQDQVLVLNTSLPVHERKMADNLKVWLLPYAHPQHPDDDTSQAYPWSPEQVDAEILKLSTPVPLQALPSEHEFSDSHGFRVQVPVGRMVLVAVDKGIASFGGYQLADKVYRTLVVPPYPKELRILGTGSLLALSGEQKVGLMARDLLGVRVELGRVLPEQLQNLVSQGQGDFSHPNFSGDFGADNLSERFVLDLPLTAQIPGTPNYQSVDLHSYLTDAQGLAKRGIFLLTASNYDPANPNASNYGEPEASDKRLLVVTDLGLIAKTEQDGGQLVFVQSIHTGLPLADAEVAVIGKNGLALFSGRTDAEGKVRFPKLSGLERERQPLFYLAKWQGDMSFLPIAREDRKLNFSRFGIDGDANAQDADQLNAYLFSDRGLYRPGDTFHIGLIVKTENWLKPLAGLPLQAEVVDARGLVVQKYPITLAAAGFNELSYTTLDTSPTGTYTVSLYTVKDGHSDQFLGQTQVKVEEFLPDSMKATVAFSKPVAEGWVHPEDLGAVVTVQNLYGAPAEARKVTASLALKPALPAFKRYADYHFYDPHYAKESYDEALADAQTDSAGIAHLALDLTKYSQASYQLNLSVRAFEAEGGRSVAAEAQTLVSDMPYLVGYKADGELGFVSKDSRRSVRLLAVAPQLQAIDVPSLSVEWVERKVLSVLTRQTDNTYQYESRPKETSLQKTVLTLPAAGYDLAIDSSKPGDYAYILRTADGLLLNRIDYSVAGSGNVSRSLDRNAELQLTLAKPEYAPGENIAVNIRAPYTGSGLITIERDKVYQSVWFKTASQSSVQTIALPEGLTGNAYVTVQFIRDASSDEIFMSPLSYAVAPFKISVAQHTQALTLNVPERIKPGEKLAIQVHSPEPTRMVVFAVDEGILQVARYQNPDPLGHFFKKRQLSVDTAQILDLILPEFKKLLQAAVPGGDGDAGAASFLNPFKRKHEQPAVYWSGIVEVNGGQTFNYTVPDTFNGTLRIIAVAVNQDRIASVNGKTLVRGELIISPNAPYSIAPGDEFKVSVSVANHVPGSGDKAAVALSLNVPPQLQVVGEGEQTLTIAEGHEAVASFTVRAVTGAAVVLGDAELKFVAKTAGKSAALSSHVSVRPANPRIADLRLGSFTDTLAVPLTRSLYSQQRQVSAGVSPLPLVSVSGLTAYLDNFAHACSEQLLSKAVPLLVLGKHPEFAETFKVDNRAADFDKLLAVLRTRQNAEGGIGLWAATPIAHEFVSAYSVNVLLEAKAAGVAVPEDMLQLANVYLQGLAASPANGLAAVRVRAYAAYLLTRQGMVTTSLLSALRENLRVNFKAELWRGDLAAVYLAASYQLLQQSAVADELLNTPLQQLGKGGGNEYAYADYYDSLIHDAQTIYLLAKHFPAKLQAMPPTLFQSIAKQITAQHYNTLSSGYLLLAYNAYLDAIPATAVKNLAITAQDKNGTQQPLALPDNAAPRVAVPESAKNLLFSGPKGLLLYYAVSEAGYDQLPPSQELREGIEILREYVNSKGDVVDSVALGEEITVRVKVRAIARTYINDVVIQDLLPAGFDAVLQNPAAEEGEDSAAAWRDRLSTGGNWQPQYTDVREDRVVLYGTVSDALAAYEYRLKATATGVFSVPPVYAEAMYEPTVRARSGAGKMRVAGQ